MKLNAYNAIRDQLRMSTIIQPLYRVYSLELTDFPPVCGISPRFPKKSLKCPQNFGKLLNLRIQVDIPIYQK